MWIFIPNARYISIFICFTRRQFSSLRGGINIESRRSFWDKWEYDFSPERKTSQNIDNGFASQKTCKSYVNQLIVSLNEPENFNAKKKQSPFSWRGWILSMLKKFLQVIDEKMRI